MLYVIGLSNLRQLRPMTPWLNASALKHSDQYEQAAQRPSCADYWHDGRRNVYPCDQTLRITPAREAGVTEKLWSLEDIARIVDEWEATRVAT